MRRREVRRFTLVDAMALVAAAAFMIAWVRVLGPDKLIERFRMSASGWQPQYVLGALDTLLTAISPCFMVATLTVLALRLRRPRPRLHRLARQPGTVACASALLTFGLEALPGLPATLWLMTQEEGWRWDWLHLSGLPSRTAGWVVMDADTGIAVLGAWTVLGCGALWRPEPDWIDRTGRLLGAGWIAVTLLKLSSLAMG